MSDEWTEGRCVACGVEGVLVKDASPFLTAGEGIEKFKVCYLCNATMSGSAAVDKDAYSRNANVLHAICRVGNEIIKRLDRLEETVEEPPGNAGYLPGLRRGSRD